MQPQRRRAHGIDPPGAQAGHHELSVGDRAQQPQRAADAGQHQPLGQEQAAHQGRARAQGSQQPNFARPLFDAQLEEQRRQEQRGHDEEEAEIDEVLAEICRAA